MHMHSHTCKMHADIHTCAHALAGKMEKKEKGNTFILKIVPVCTAVWLPCSTHCDSVINTYWKRTAVCICDTFLENNG